MSPSAPSGGDTVGDAAHHAASASGSAAATTPPRRPGPGGFAPSMPPLVRGSMTPRPWHGFARGLMVALGRAEADANRRQAANAPTATPAAWEIAAGQRRNVLLALIACSTVFAAAVLASAQPASDQPLLQWLQIGLFSLLFAWVSAGCFTAAMGFWVLVRGDRHAMSRHSVGTAMIPSDARTAVIMPICNEDVATVFAGLRATCESLAATGKGEHFDVFVLSDSSDPALRAAEVEAWSELRQQLGADGARVHYRWRQHRRHRKAGNVADFCRRWGRAFRYMVVLDADSVMSGDCLTTLVRLMEAHPSAGILQTAPQAAGHATLHARAQQFASRVTGRLFAAGMQYWQLGEAHYWGHNAIIRVEPFMQHCALAPIVGGGTLSGDILSHDFVEAALMRRAGYHVWLVADLAGSYEQQPPHLLAELQRDRRWCQGNLQNARLITEPGLHAVHRGMLATGAMAYLSAPLWLVYMALGTLLWLEDASAFTAPEGGGVAFSVACLWAGTFALLALPRLLGVAAVLLKGEQRFYGGAARLVQSSVLEAALSVLQSPLRMVAHTLFVVGALTGWQLQWKSPPREATDVAWRQAAASFAPAGVVAALVVIALSSVSPAALLWLLPVALPLLFAVPLTVMTSRSRFGQRIRGARLLLVPEESWTPAVLRRAWSYSREPRRVASWTEVLADARLCALLGAAMGPRRTAQGLRGHFRRRQVEQVMVKGGVAPVEAMRFLNEPNSLRQLRAAALFTHHDGSMQTAASA